MTDDSMDLPRFLRVGTRHPGRVLMLILFFSVAALLGIMRIKTDTSLDRLIKQDGNDRQAYLHVAREFGSDQRSFIYVRDDQLWSPEKIALLERLHEDLRRLPFVERIDDLFTSPTVTSSDGQLHSHALLLAAPSDEHGAGRARQAAIGNPIAAKNLVSEDGKSIAIGIAIREKYSGSDVAEVGEKLEKVLAPVRPRFSTLVHIGPAPTEAGMQEGLRHDLRILLPAAALAAACIIFLLCRSLSAAAITLMVAALTLIWTLGMMGYAGIPLTILSATLPGLILVVITIKMIRMTYDGNDRASPGRKEDAPRELDQSNEFMKRNFGLPFLATVGAMALGFGFNVFSDIRPIRDFGVVAAFAMLASGLITILVVPALYTQYGSRLLNFRRIAVIDIFADLASRAIGLLRRRITAWIILLAALALSGLIQRAGDLHISTDPLGFFRSHHPLVEAADRMHQDLAGVSVFYITLDANAPGAFRDPANLKRISDIQAFITKQHVFDRSTSLVNLIAQANQEAAGGRPDAFSVPPSRKLLGQYLLLYPPQALEPYISHDLRRANIVVRHNIRESSRLNQHLRELRQAVSSYAGPTMVTAVVGENLLINDAADRLIMDLAKVCAAILIFVFIGVSLMYTSIKGGIVALVPCGLPMLVILGGMRILEMPVSTATVVVAIIIIGVAVDGTLHLFSRYSELCRHTHDYRQAMVDAMKHETAALVAISLALAAIFATLAFSDFALISQFAILTAVAMTVALFANLLMTPLIMSRIRLVGLYEILAMSMQRDTLVKSPLFHGMSDYQIRKTILISELCRFKESECLIEQGTRGRSMYLVISGHLEVMRRDDSGGRRQALLGPGDVFGEIGFVNSTYRTADVRALDEVAVLRFDYDRLESNLMLFPHIMAKLNFNISGILGRRLAEVVEEYEAPPAPAAGSPASKA